MKAGVKCVFVFLAVFLLATALCGHNTAEASSWVSAGTWPAGSGYSINALTTGTDGKIWAAGGGGYTAYWNGSSWVSTGQWPHGNKSIFALTTGTDGKIWAAGGGGCTAYWNGSSWVSAGTWSRGSYGIYALTTGTDGKIWAGGECGYVDYWDGSSWINTGAAFNEHVMCMTTATDGTIWVAGYSSKCAYRSGSSWTQVNAYTYPKSLFTGPDGRILLLSTCEEGNATLRYWNGSSWSNIGTTIPGYLATVGTDGRYWVVSDCYTYYWNGSSWVRGYNQGPGFYPYAITVGSDGKIWVAGYRAGYGGFTAYRNTSNSGLSLVPSPNGMTGQLVVNPRSSDDQGILVNLQWSTDGSSYTNLGVPGAGTFTVTPTTSTMYFRLELKYQRLPGQFQTVYSNVVSVSTLASAPSVTVSTSRAQWDSSRGRAKISLSWPSVTGATGYKLHIWDGYQYRTKDLGNATSWDSSSNKVFPLVSELTENNSVTTNIFHFDGSGLDFEDTPLRLYRTTARTDYDNDSTVYIRVTAYNSWMETNFDATSSFKTFTLPNATDTVAPSGTASVTSAEGFKKTYNADVNVAVTASDSQSGVWKVELSNDGTTYTAQYTATKNSDGGTSVSSYNNTFTWTLSPGAGTKTVYMRVTDAVGRTYVVTDQIALAEDMLPPSVTLTINGGAESTTSATVTLTVAAQDNASASSQMQMRFSNNGTLWSSWEAFGQTKTWDITNASYGGSSSAGVKTVYVQVCDAAQNTALAYDDIGYNPSPPSGTVTISGGASGTWNGQPALFTATDTPTLNLSYSSVSQMRFDLGAGVWTDWESYNSSKTVCLIKSQGVCRLRVQAKDSYGVTSTPREFLVVVDPTPPTISVLRGQNGATATTTTSVMLEITATDNLPGTLQYRYKVNSGSFTSWANLSGGTISVSGLASGANSITVEVKDQAGNTASKSATIFKV